MLEVSFGGLPALCSFSISSAERADRLSRDARLPLPIVCRSRCGEGIACSRSPILGATSAAWNATLRVGHAPWEQGERRKGGAMRGSTRASGLTCLLATMGPWVGGLQGVAKAQDTLVQWTGVLELIDGDAGSGAFSGGIPSVSPFEGYFVHPTSCAAGCVIELFPPDATNYVFSGGAGPAG